jgi:predicted SAM-dependent methyltransferase
LNQPDSLAERARPELIMHQRLPSNLNREAAIRSLFDATGRGLEIGPSYNPIVPKAGGHRVEIVDHLDTAALRRKYASEPNVDASRIEEVDHVWSGEPLSELVGTDTYDYVVASHVIEHTPDMLGFLRECAAVLRSGGRLVLVVPDKRRCFDFFRPVSSTGGVLQAHAERRTRHLPGAAFDQIANCATLGGQVGWMEQARGPLGFLHPLAAAQAIFERFRSAADYLDCHAWVFTPSSFRLIVSDLNALGMLALREEGVWATDVFEFVVILSRSGAGCPESRRDLLLACQEESTVNPFTTEAG